MITGLCKLNIVPHSAFVKRFGKIKSAGSVQIKQLARLLRYLREITPGWRGVDDKIPLVVIKPDNIIIVQTLMCRAAVCASVKRIHRTVISGHGRIFFQWLTPVCCKHLSKKCFAGLTERASCVKLFTKQDSKGIFYAAGK